MKPHNLLCHEKFISRNLVAIWKWNSMKMKALAISMFVALSMITLSVVLTDPSSDCLWCMNYQDKLFIKAAIVVKIDDKLHGGLLKPELDENSCESRYRKNLYRRSQLVGPPSSYLISRLRNYEELHKQCGPNTEPYKKVVEDIKYGRNATDSSSCKYVIYNPIRGLGNRMLTLGATFLYTLVTNRVLFIGHGDMADLFCEPFPEVSWKLPSEFPIDRFKDVGRFSYEKLMQSDTFRNSSNVPLFVNLNFGFGYVNNTKNFFCDQDQELLQKVPWLIITSDLYFLPSLFFIPSFQEELNNLFPRKEAVFHHLGNYIFHPSNIVWGLITRYYDAYLAKADEMIGIQIRVYRHTNRKTPSINQTLSCALTENLLPGINSTRNVTIRTDNRKTKAVLFTSLSTNHSKELRKMYWDYATTTGEAISVYQASHDEHQRSENQMHDSRALADIYLLSFSDKLMISGLSTFGYAAQSLGGLRPWILDMPFHDEVPNPPCKKASSMEPCYHFFPPFFSCRNASRIKTAYHLPYVQQCEDIRQGLKLIDL